MLFLKGIAHNNHELYREFRFHNRVILSLWLIVSKSFYVITKLTTIFRNKLKHLSSFVLIYIFIVITYILFKYNNSQEQTLKNWFR